MRLRRLESIVFCAALVLARSARADEARKAAAPKKAASMADHIITPDMLKFAPAPPVLPAGAEIAGLNGDMTKKGSEFAVRLRLPDGWKIPPHFHPTDETVEVKKGTLLVGMGDKLDLSKAKAMKAGDKGSLPAKAHHFAAAQGATFISVSSMGPFALTYVNPADDPQKQVAKP